MLQLYDSMMQRASDLAVYIIENRTTIRAAAKHFGVSKSTVHKDISERLGTYQPALYRQVRDVLEINKAERHIRGGITTKQKYEKQRGKKPRQRS